jgi:transposase
MEQIPRELKLETLERKKIKKLRRKEKDSRIHRRLSALLWLDEGHSVEEVAKLLDVCPRTVRNWVRLFQAEGGLEVLCSLEYNGDPG